MTIAMDQPGQMETLAALVAARVREILAVDDGWLGRQAAADYAGMGGSALSAGFNRTNPDVPVLHHHRLGSNGHPRTKRAVIDAWLIGASEQQQRQICGCDRLHRWTPK